MLSFQLKMVGNQGYVTFRIFEKILEARQHDLTCRFEIHIELLEPNQLSKPSHGERIAEPSVCKCRHQTFLSTEKSTVFSKRR